MKRCLKCGQEKDDWEFSPDNRAGDGLRVRCKECVNKSDDNKYGRDRALRYNYGITEAQFELMLKSQNNVCTICGQLETRKYKGKIIKLSVDHNHKTFKVRDLVCHKCNIRLAALEDKDWLKKALAYLKKHE